MALLYEKRKKSNNLLFRIFFLSVLSVHKNFHTYLSPSFSIKCLAVTSIEEKVFPAPQLASGGIVCGMILLSKYFCFPAELSCSMLTAINQISLERKDNYEKRRFSVVL